MASEQERKMLAEKLAGLTGPALRALCIRYGTGQSRVGLWAKRKDQLIEQVLEHADQLLRGYGKRTDPAEGSAALARCQAEIKAGQEELKGHIQAERQTLEAYLDSKLRVGSGERFLNSMGSWASIVGLVVALGVLLWPEPPEMYQLTLRVLERDGSPAVGATVSAPPWPVVAEADHWLVSIPVAETPAEGAVRVKAQLGEGFVEKKVPLARQRQFSETLVLRYPDGVITGIILSPTGQPLGGASVSIFNYEHEAVLTAEDGSFSIPAHVPNGESARLTARKGDWGRAQGFIAGLHYEIALIDRTKSVP